MTPNERGLLTHFLNSITQVQGVAKDLEADTLIHQTIASNPDALYLLVQHALIAEQTLQAAQAHIRDLEAQARTYGAQPAQGSFLGAYADSRQNVQPFAQSTSFFGQSAPGGGLGGFLKNVGTTAAGVAAGDLLFEGIEDLFGGGSRGFF